MPTPHDLNYFVIRIILALAWFGVSMSGLLSLADLSGFLIVLGIATASPVFMAALLYRSIGPRYSVVLDTTVLYAMYMLHLFASVDPSEDALTMLVFLFYPVYAIVLLTLEVAAIGVWKHFRRRSSDDPGATG